LSMPGPVTSSYTTLLDSTRVAAASRLDFVQAERRR
jgi:hypothetical protein